HEAEGGVARRDDEVDGQAVELPAEELAKGNLVRGVLEALEVDELRVEVDSLRHLQAENPADAPIDLGRRRRLASSRVERQDGLLPGLRVGAADPYARTLPGCRG